MGVRRRQYVVEIVADPRHPKSVERQVLNVRSQRVADVVLAVDDRVRAFAGVFNHGVANVVEHVGVVAKAAN